MRLKYLALAAGALLLPGSAVSAAIVTKPLHLRSGPGIKYRVISTMPAGAHVGVRTCSAGWCHVRFRSERGWAAADYLGRGRNYGYTTRYRVYGSAPRDDSSYYAAPGYNAYAEAPGYGYYDNGPGYDNGFGFGIGPFGFSVGFGPDWSWRGGWHHHGWYDYHH